MSQHRDCGGLGCEWELVVTYLISYEFPIHEVIPVNELYCVYFVMKFCGEYVAPLWGQLSLKSIYGALLVPCWFLQRRRRVYRRRDRAPR